MDWRQPCVYILTSKPRGTLYVGVTGELVRRVWQHKNHVIEGFTCRHHVHSLIWYEMHETMASAIVREKRLKEWKRMWKIRLIEERNPDWLDLYPTIC